MSAPVRVPLHVHAELYRQMRENLAETYGLEADDPAILDTLDGASDLGDVIASMVRRSRELEAQADSLSKVEKTTRERRMAKVEAAQRLRAQVVHTMSEVGMPRLERPDFTVSLRWNQAGLAGADTLDPETLDPRFVRIKREVNRVAITEALKAGEVIEGVAIGNPTRALMVK